MWNDSNAADVGSREPTDQVARDWCLVLMQLRFPTFRLLLQIHDELLLEVPNQHVSLVSGTYCIVMIVG